MVWTTKPEAAQYFRAAFFILTTTIILVEINLGVIKTFPILTEGFINLHIKKLINTTMRRLHMRLQGMKSTRKKNTDTYINNKCKTNVVFCTNMDRSKMKEEILLWFIWTLTYHIQQIKSIHLRNFWIGLQQYSDNWYKEQK